MALPTANNVNNPVAWGYGASIDDLAGTATSKLYLRLADSPERVSGIQTAEPPELPKIQQNPEDFIVSRGTVFSRSRFAAGEGLDRAHRVVGDQQFDVARFWNSRNIRIQIGRPGNPEELTLLKDTSAWRVSTNTNHHMAWMPNEPVTGPTLFWAEGNDVKKTTDPTASTPTVGSEDPEAGGTPTAVSGLAVLGDELYAAIGAEGIHKRDNAGTWAHWSDLDCSGNKIWSVKGRIFASTGASLYEAGATSTSTLLKTLASGETWTDVIDAGTVILASATDGSVYAWADEGGTLVLKGQEDFEGEVPYAMGMAQGLLFVGTGEVTTGGGKIGRLWIAEVIGQRIRNAQVVREWGDGSEARDRTPRAFFSTRDTMFFGVIEDGTETHLWRFHLETAGLTRDIIFAGSAVVQGITRIDNRLFASLTGDDIWRENTTFATEGWLISPLADFFTSQPKIWVGARCDSEIPITQETIDLYYSTNPDSIEDPDDAGWTSVITYTSSTTQANINAETALSNVESRYVGLKLKLTPSTDQTTSPSVFSFSIRALPIPEDLVLRLHVNVSDMVVMPNRKPFRVPEQGKRIWEELRDNWDGRHVEAELFRPSVKVRGQVTLQMTPIMGRPERGSVQTYMIMDIEGLKVA